jgi:hypothetical protein
MSENTKTQESKLNEDQITILESLAYQMVSNQLKLPSNNSIQFLEKLFTTPTL